MNWPKAIWAEMKRSFQLTFVNPSEGKPDIFGRPRRGSWTSDRHLKTGFYIAAPIFILVGWPLMMTNPKVFPWIPLLGLSFLSNLVWLGYAAWSRHRAGES